MITVVSVVAAAQARRLGLLTQEDVDAVASQARDELRAIVFDTPEQSAIAHARMDESLAAAGSATP